MRLPLALLTVAVSALPAFALTIDRDTVWRGAQTFRETVRIESGATLTIAPGANISFEGGRLEVAGRLISDGARIGGKGWEGIVLKGCDERTAIVGGTVEGATTGIFIGGGAPRIDGVTVRGNDVGIEIKQQSRAVVKGCRISGNRKVGIFVKDEATPTVTDNTIEKNGKFGAYIYRSLPQHFSANRLIDNETGMMISNVGSDPTVEGNRFEGNRIAILVDRAARPRLRANLLRENRTGMRLYRRADPLVEGNRFEKNDDALSLAYSSYPAIRGNDFVANRRAIFLEFQSSTWERERGETTREAEAGSRSAFAESSGHAATAGERRKPEELTGTIDAKDNWWGEEGTAELMRTGKEGNPSFIHDGRDAPTFAEGGKVWPLDRVDFAPWRQTPIGFKEVR